MDIQEINFLQSNYGKMLTFYEENEILERWAARTLEVKEGAPHLKHRDLYGNLKAFTIEKQLPLCKSIALLNFLYDLSTIKKGTKFYTRAGTNNVRVWVNLAFRAKPITGKLTADHLNPWRMVEQD